jgi:hypothetical protein
MNQKLKDKWNELVDNGLMQVTIFALGSVVLILLAIKLWWSNRDGRAQRDGWGKKLGRA